MTLLPARMIEDPSKNEGIIFQKKSMGFFSDAQGQVSVNLKVSGLILPHFRAHLICFGCRSNLQE